MDLFSRGKNFLVSVGELFNVGDLINAEDAPSAYFARYASTKKSSNVVGFMVREPSLDGKQK